MFGGKKPVLGIYILNEILLYSIILKAANPC
jgi:hypothetical protein